MSTLHVSHLGPTPYRDGLALQEGLVKAHAAGRTGDWLLFPDHPSVLTIGRNPSPDALLVEPAELERRGIEVFRVARGGDITWHGPGQLVGYPILGLEVCDRDLHKLLRSIEEVVIRTLAAFGVTGERSPGRTGVWVGERKIASIGVAVRQWVSYHGFALNVRPDLADFDLIHPCGLEGVRMTSIAALAGDGGPDLAQVRRQATADLAQVFGYEQVLEVPASAAWAARDQAAETAAS